MKRCIFVHQSLRNFLKSKAKLNDPGTYVSERYTFGELKNLLKRAMLHSDISVYDNTAMRYSYDWTLISPF